MKQYNKIMTVFGKTASKLEALAESNAGKAELVNAKILDLEAKSADLSAEATQAYLMAHKLNEFLEV
jgi:hypothetical protein